MNPFVAEFIGTGILILLGCGVNANVSLRQTKGSGSGWMVICAGWGFAVFTAVLCVGEFSGAHINPAVTIGLAAANEFPWERVPGYVAAQMAGAILGAALVWICHQRHFEVTEDADAKLGTFATAPAIPAPTLNFFCEAVATFVLVYAVLLTQEPSFEFINGSGRQTVKVGLGSIGAVRVGLIVFAIGLCLGGTTGYAINPARDLGPRIAHALLPIPGKRDSDWGYAGIPVFGPVAGGLLAAGLYRAL